MAQSIDKPDAARQARRREDLGAPKEAPKRILVVDDEPAIRESLSEILGNELSKEYADCLIGTAASAEEALGLLSATTVDVLVTDYLLPAMNGLELAQRVGSRSPETRAILMTAYGNDTIVERARCEGLLGYLEKPLNIDELLGFVREAMCPPQGIRLSLEPLCLRDALLLIPAVVPNASVSIVSCEGRGALEVRDRRIIQAELGGVSGIEALAALLGLEQARLSASEAHGPADVDLDISFRRAEKAITAPSLEARLDILSNAQSAEEEVEDDTARSIAQVVANFEAKRLASLRNGPRRATAGSGALGAERSTPVLSETDRRQVRNLVNEGVHHFKAKRLLRAKACWEEALRLDGGCVQARENLRVLKEVVKWHREQQQLPRDEA